VGAANNPLAESLSASFIAAGTPLLTGVDTTKARFSFIVHNCAAMGRRFSLG
jgi:hypothetical protein